ncbi:MAG: hypothetical protein ACXWJC_00420 [Croceibacterium sp.]
MIPPAERMTVSLADDVSVESTAPNPSQEAQAAVAPVLAPESEPLPAPVTEPIQPPVHATIERPVPQPKPANTPAPKATSKPKEIAKAQPAPSNKSGGGSRIGADFLKGISSGERANAGTPATQAGPEVQASIASAMIRQIKPHWRAPEGVDADKLVTILDFDLNPDGSLNGQPRLVRQDGITPSNKPQAAVHVENAIRAIKLAAPFELPKQYYDTWKHLRGIRFDRNL